MDYWKECISEALEVAGIEATKDQLDTVVSYVDSAHRNYSLATEWKLLDSVPCQRCKTAGIIPDAWGRDQTCYYCEGSGRHK